MKTERPPLERARALHPLADPAAGATRFAGRPACCPKSSIIFRPRLKASDLFEENTDTLDKSKKKELGP